MTKLSTILEKRGTCGVYAWDGPFGLDDLDELARQHGVGLFVLRGTQLRSNREFLEHAAAVFSFPIYFGKNWDAFADCLTDMSWIDQDGFLVVVVEPRQLADDSANYFKIVLEIFREAADFWQKEEKTFLVIVQDSTGEKWSLPSISL
jgi:RNAse (barnase) inhibitor barstar